MKVTVELSDEDIKILQERQKFQMQWIKAGMEEKKPFDIVVQKILNTAKEVQVKEI